MAAAISCTICSECYSEEDNIYATDCGHVFHYGCLMRSKCRSHNCPVCTAVNPGTIKLFLNFVEEDAAVLPPPRERYVDNSDDELDPNVLDQSNIQLQLENNLRVQNALKMELNKSIDEITALQAKLQEQQELQLKLAEKFSEKEIHVDVVHGYVHTLAQQRDDRENELNRKSEELKKLELQLQKICEGGGNVEQLDIAMATKLTIMEKKLKAVSEQLYNEVARTTELTLENTKLQHMLCAKTTPTLPRDGSVGEAATATAVVPPTTNGSKQGPPQHNNHNLEQIIVIKGLPKRLIDVNWFDVVVPLAQCLGIEMPRADIRQIYQLGGTNNFDENGRMALVVKFKVAGYKEKFMNANEKLAMLPDFKDWHIDELKNTRTHSSIFEHAKILRKYGFKSVYVHHGKLLAKKADGDRSIVIRSKEQVDALIEGGN